MANLIVDPMYLLKRAFFLSIFFLSFLVGNCQKKNFEIVSLEMENNFSFPVFSKSNDTLLGNKINHLLQLTELELLHGYEKKNPFERVAINLINPIPGKEMIQYSIYQNNARLLSFSLAQSFCGAGCTYWCSYYNFNPENGELIHLKDLFSPKGYEVFIQKLDQKRIAVFKQWINKQDSSKREEFEGIPTCYEHAPNTDYYIKNDSIFIDGSICFGKNLMYSNLDPITSFHKKELKKYLNDYGLLVFGFKKGKLTTYHSNHLPQLFTGKLADDSIAFILSQPQNGNLNGVYFNKTTGQCMQLRGGAVKEGIKLDEFDEEEKPQGSILFRFNNQNLIGIRFTKDKKQRQAFEVHP